MSAAPAASAAVQSQETPSQKKLKPEEIRFLALEGGGGKGFAYLGAIEVLEKLQVMPHVEGISGTSAGAITALMLTLGMTAADITNELETYDFNMFFDPAVDSLGKRFVPTPLAYTVRKNDKGETSLLEGSIDPRDIVPMLLALQQEKSALASTFGMLAWLYSLEGDVGAWARNFLAGLLQSQVAPVAALLRQLPEYLAFFHRDMGFFSGLAARTYFDNLIRRFAKAKQGIDLPSSAPSMPFIILKELFKKDLLVCGANLSTGKTVLFSAQHTPYFPVADAVRISMSLPLVYKPYVIRKGVLKYPPCGTYVDGGIWNNLPFREIGNLSKLAQTTKVAKDAKSPSAATRPAAEGLQTRSLADTLSDRTTLGLRLQIDVPQKVLTGGDLIAAFLSAGQTAGESQVTADIEPFTLVLDTDGLDLLKFKPDDNAKKVVQPRSRRAMYSYFGKVPPAEDANSADDARVEAARAKSVCD
jgi:predicted acylesterase/phospholipase RssA